MIQYISKKIDERVTLVIFLALTLVSTVIYIYWPSLNGPFIFDDWHNLSRIGEYPELDSLQRLLIYITHEGTSLISRPVSFLSFYINDSAWPSNPKEFRYTNIAIHAVNTLLVFWLSFKIIRLTSYGESQSNLLKLSFVIALLWGLHPIQVNAVAYIVQRMTLLSGLFTFSGLILYVSGREQIIKNSIRAGLILMSLSVLVFMPLAFLSKETGVLLPLFILVLELTLFKILPGHMSALRWSYCFVAVPVVIAISGIFIVRAESIYQAYDVLPYDAVERLLTQSRILWDYLRSIILPMARTSSLFHDNYPISTSLFNPVSTLFSIAGWLLVFTIAVLIRNLYPVFSFAVFWFLAGHLIESTVIGLEIYYEHRNYVPSYAVLFACVVSINHGLRNKVKTLLLLMTVYVGLISFVTYMNTSKWRSEFDLVTSWYQNNPTSIRTSKGVLNILIATEKYDKAREIVLKQQRNWPKSAELNLILLLIDCNSGKLTKESVTEQLSNIPYNYQHSNTLFLIVDNLIKAVNNKLCNNISLNEIELVIHHLLQHPSITDKNKSGKWGFFTANLYYQLAILLKYKGDLSAAILALNKGNQLWPTLKLIDIEINWLIESGRYEDALKISNEAIIYSKENTVIEHLSPRQRIIIEKAIQLELINEQKNNTN